MSVSFGPFIHPLMGLVSSKINDDSTYLIALLQRLNEVVDTKYLAQCQYLNALTCTHSLVILKLPTQRVVRLKLNKIMGQSSA